MRQTRKQKTLIGIGIIVILLTPLVIFLCSPLIAVLLCLGNEGLQTVCMGWGASIGAVILFFVTLLVGVILILLGTLPKKKSR